jgi:hypothetical protein
MKSQLDGEIPEYSLRPRNVSPPKAPWIIMLLAMCGAGAMGFFALGLHEKKSELQREVDKLGPRATTAEAKAKDLTAKLEIAEAERTQLAAAKDELSKNVASKDEELTKLKATETQLRDKLKVELASNWELSAARAINVVRFLQEKATVPGERLVASGYGEFHPVASNKSSMGRAKNRRIEILLVPTMAPKAIGKSKLAERAQKKSK